MNTPSNAQSNVVSDSVVESKALAPAEVSPTQLFYWSVKRELWENRSIYLAPLVVAGLFLFGFLISTAHLPEKMRAAAALAPAKQMQMVEQPYTFAAILIMGVAFIVALFYCLDALHGERRDRSILFWKSLPVSDLTTVLAKASIPLLVLPLLTFATTITLQCIMLLLSTVILLGNASSLAMLWGHVSLFQMSLMLLYHLLAIHSLWYAPIYAWLLLVSGWARRMPFLWAALPVVAIFVVEKIAFNTSHSAAFLGRRLGGGAEGSAFLSGSRSMDPLMHINPGQFLISPGLWIGLALAAAFLIAAARLRRYQGPI